MKTYAITKLFLSASLISAGAAQMTDMFNSRPQTSGFNEVLSANTTYATTETGEPVKMHGGSGGRSEWAEWIAPANGRVTIDTVGSLIYPVFAVYTGAGLGELKTVARGLYSGSQSHASATFPVTAGTAYQVAIDSRTGSKGMSQLNLRFSAAAMPNAVTGADRFVERAVLEGSQAIGVAGIAPASFDTFQPKQTGRARDVWWQWTAPATGVVTIDTLESTTDTMLTVYSGVPVNDPPFADLDMVARNADVPNSKCSQVVFQTEAGRSYQIAVGDEYGGALGNIILKLNLVPNNLPAAVPGTDLFVHRPDLEGVPCTGVACNTFGDLEAFEASSPGGCGRTVWWSWKAPATGTMVVDTQGSGIGTTLRIYTGWDLATLPEVAFNDDVPGGRWSMVELRAVKDTVYQIRVDGDYGDKGNIVLNLKTKPGPEIDVQQPAGSSLVDGSAKRSFGKVRIGTSGVTKVFTIRNAGNTTLSGLRTAKSAASSKNFIVAQPAKAALAPGETTTFKVTFKPRVRGTRKAQILVLSNDADESSFDIQVSGLGKKR